MQFYLFARNAPAREMVRSYSLDRCHDCDRVYTNHIARARLSPRTARSRRPATRRPTAREPSTRGRGPLSLTAANLLGLQRDAGNQAVSALVARETETDTQSVSIPPGTPMKKGGLTSKFL